VSKDKKRKMEEELGLRFGTDWLRRFGSDRVGGANYEGTGKESKVFNGGDCVRVVRPVKKKKGGK